MVVTRARNWRWEEVSKDSVELDVLTKHFELYNRTEGKSPKTIDWYNQALRQFHRFLVESEKPTRLGRNQAIWPRLYPKAKNKSTISC